MEKENGERELCPLHKRQKQLVCITDKQKICSHCALFGNHQYHRIITESDVVKEIEAVKNALRSVFSSQKVYLNLVQEICKQFNEEWTEQRIHEEIEFNKGLVLDKIYIWFENAKKELEKQQGQMEEQIMKSFDEILQK